MNKSFIKSILEATGSTITQGVKTADDTTKSGEKDKRKGKRMFKVRNKHKVPGEMKKPNAGNYVPAMKISTGIPVMP